MNLIWECSLNWGKRKMMVQMKFLISILMIHMLNF